MENSALLQLGVGGIFAILIIREVLSFLKTRNGKGDGARHIEELIGAMARETSDLHNWHMPDDRGEQTWKNAQLREAIQDMKTVVQNNTKAFERLEAMLERERN